jgi:hypothetical protein
MIDLGHEIQNWAFMWIGQGKHTALNNTRLVEATYTIKILDLIIRFVIYTIVEIQRELFERNTKLPEEHKMLFRLGANLGDVVEEGHRIYGDGVNIAARVEGLAEGGGICVSGTVYDQVKNKLVSIY